MVERVEPFMSAEPECVEHVWSMTGVTLDNEGSLIEYECTRCGALTMETPRELRGEV
jgi:hypothetical protein